MQNHRHGPSLRGVITNMRVDMPWPRKIYLLFRNNWIKIKTWNNCCGHHGEPGC